MTKSKMVKNGKPIHRMPVNASTVTTALHPVFFITRFSAFQQGPALRALV